MGDRDSDHDASDLPDLANRGAVIRFLERNDIALPDGLTSEKIKSRGCWWAIDDESFSFRVERHPSGPFPSTSMTGRGMPTPARWHIRKRYTYDLTIDEWDADQSPYAGVHAPEPDHYLVNGKAFPLTDPLAIGEGEIGLIRITNVGYDTHALHLASSATLSSTSTESGRTTGRKERVCGQMGVMRMAGTFGWTMEPPALTL